MLLSVNSRYQPIYCPSHLCCVYVYAHVCFICLHDSLCYHLYPPPSIPKCCHSNSRLTADIIKAVTKTSVSDTMINLQQSMGQLACGEKNTKQKKRQV
uniref:Uncharacterized protein n=1 Tax=Oryzias latipes TaxID=8090 RepID=A0A3P9H4I4_ORYLA